MAHPPRLKRHVGEMELYRSNYVRYSQRLASRLQCQRSGTKSGDKACMLASLLPMQPTPNHPHSTSSAPGGRQDVQAIRSAAAETLLKAALGLSVSSLDFEEVRIFRRDMDRPLAGRLRKTADWRRRPRTRTRSCTCAWFGPAKVPRGPGVGFCWVALVSAEKYSPRPNALKAKTFSTVTPNFSPEL